MTTVVWLPILIWNTSPYTERRDVKYSCGFFPRLSKFPNNGHANGPGAVVAFSLFWNKRMKAQTTTAPIKITDRGIGSTEDTCNILLVDKPRSQTQTDVIKAAHPPDSCATYFVDQWPPAIIIRVGRERPLGQLIHMDRNRWMNPLCQNAPSINTAKFHPVWLTAKADPYHPRTGPRAAMLNIYPFSFNSSSFV